MHFLLDAKFLEYRTGEMLKIIDFMRCQGKKIDSFIVIGQVDLR